MSASSSVGRLLRCYPAAWRARYGEELHALVLDMSDGGRVPWRTRADVICAGGRERLRAAGLGNDAAAASVAFDVLIGTAVLASVLVLAGIGDDAKPPASGARGWLATNPTSDPGGRGATVAVIAATVGLVKTERCLPLPTRRLGAQVRLAGGVAVAMAVMTAATAVWWIVVGERTSAALTGSHSAHASAAVPELILALVVMVSATGLSGFGARRATRSLPALAAR